MTPISVFHRNFFSFKQFQRVRIQTFSAQKFLQFLFKSMQNFQFWWNFGGNFAKFIGKKREKNEISFFHSTKNLDDFLLKFWDLNGAKDCKPCRNFWDSLFFYLRGLRGGSMREELRKCGFLIVESSISFSNNLLYCLSPAWWAQIRGNLAGDDYVDYPT